MVCGNGAKVLLLLTMMENIVECMNGTYMLLTDDIRDLITAYLVF